VFRPNSADFHERVALGFFFGLFEVFNCDEHAFFQQAHEVFLVFYFDSALVAGADACELGFFGSGEISRDDVA